MHESFLQSSLLRPEDVVLDFERDDISDWAIHKILKVIESGDKILVELAEDLGIKFDYNGSMLIPEQRQALSKKCLLRPGYDAFNTALRKVREAIESNDEMLLDVAADLGIGLGFYDDSVLTLGQRQALSKNCLVMLGYEADNAFENRSFETGKAEEASKEMTKEEIDALGIQVDYDGSRLTPEQKQALFKSYWVTHLKMIGLRSPKYYVQYYGDKSQCLSVSETAWPGTVTYLEAEKLKRGFIEPEDLIERLGKLKPSDNFEVRKFRHPRMEWKSPTPLEEEGLEIEANWPTWLYDQLYAVSALETQLGRKSAVQHRQEIKDSWDAFESSVELTPLPDLHLLRDMGRSPGGTLFPWYLVKGLMALREDANNRGDKAYREEYNRAKEKREEAINRWRERNPDSILIDDPLSIYKSWPTDLMAELHETDREAIRCGRRKYVTILRETEPKMQALVAFWSDCGLVTGQRTTPSCWWQDPKAKAEQLPKPQSLQERLNAINTEFGYHSETAEKLRMIETSRWMESIINGDSEPTAPETPLPQLLLDELDIVWRDRDWLDGDDTEDEMIARIRRWRSKHRQCVEEGLYTSQQLGSDTGSEEPVQTANSSSYFRQINLLRGSASGSVIAPEETRQLQEKRPRGARRQPRTNPTAEDRAIWRGRLRPRTKTEDPTTWRDRLRPRSDTVGALHDRTKIPNTQTRKPQGIVKRRKALKEKRPAATKGQVNTSTIQKADPSHPGTQAHVNTRSLQAIPNSVPKSRRTKKRRRQPLQQASAAQPQGVRKARNGNRRPAQGLMGAVLTTNFEQELFHLLTPPQSK